MRTAWLSLLVFAALTGPASAAWKTTATPASADTTSLVSDGKRYVVVPNGSGSALVFDDRAPKAGWRPLSFDPNCQADQGVALGRFAVYCAANPTDPYALPTASNGVVDIASGAFTPIDLGVGSDNSRISTFGRQWVQYSLPMDRFAGGNYRNLSTGATGDISGATEIADLDAPVLAHHLCNPVHLFPNPNYLPAYGGSPYLPGELDGRWLVTGAYANPGTRGTS